MKVVFLEDVPGVANGGDIREVKNGFARNYLIPKNLAVPATHNALQRVGGLTKEADVVRLKTLADMKALAEALEGVQVDVEMRAGSTGRLYGSVTNTIVAEELSKITDREIDRRAVLMAESIREVGTFDVRLRLHPDVEAQISVVVFPTGTDPSEMVAAEAPEAGPDEEAASETKDEAP